MTMYSNVKSVIKNVTQDLWEHSDKNALLASVPPEFINLSYMLGESKRRPVHYKFIYTMKDPEEDVEQDIYGFDLEPGEHALSKLAEVEETCHLYLKNKKYSQSDKGADFGFYNIPEVAINSFWIFCYLFLFHFIWWYPWNKNNRVRYFLNIFVTLCTDNQMKMLPKNEEFSFNVSKIAKGIWLWMKMDHAFLESKLKMDSIKYLFFQRCLLKLALKLTFLTLSTNLVINIVEGKLFVTGKDNRFPSTTIMNLGGKSPWLLVPVVVNFIYLPITIGNIRRYTKEIMGDDEMVKFGKTVILLGLPPQITSRAKIKRWFELEYPGNTIKHIRMAVRYNKLYALEESRKLLIKILAKIEVWEMRNGKIMTNYVNSRAMWWQKSNVHSKEYYMEKYKEVMTEIRLEFYNIVRRKQDSVVDIAFVTFEHFSSSQKIMRYVGSRRNLLQEFRIKRAPPARYIMWEYLQSYSYLRFKVWGWNFIILTLLFLATSPEAAFELVSSPFSIPSGKSSESEYLPTIQPIALTLITSILPLLVRVVTEKSGCFYTRNRIAYETLKRVYIYVVLMLFIFPHLGLSSIKAVLRGYFMLDEDDDEDLLRDRERHYVNEFKQSNALRFQCIFQSVNGAFFINNSVSMALFGNMIFFARLAWLIFAALFSLRSKTQMEYEARMEQLHNWTYTFGESAAWCLFHFTVGVGLASLCPLVMVSTLLFLSIKHCVDSYWTICHIFFTAPADRKFFCLIFNIIMIALLIGQVNTFLFVYVGTTNDKGEIIVIVCAYLMVASMFFVALQISTNQTWPIDLLPHQTNLKMVPRRTEYTPYIPPLLRKESRLV